MSKVEVSVIYHSPEGKLEHIIDEVMSYECLESLRARIIKSLDDKYINDFKNVQIIICRNNKTK